MVEEPAETTVSDAYRPAEGEPDAVALAYKRLREAQRRLNAALTKTLSKKAIEESAKRLGFWNKRGFVFDDEHHMAVLMDFAIYDYRSGAKSAVERYAANQGAGLGEDERLVLGAIVRARFTLVAVGAPLGPATRTAYDILYDEEFVLADEGLRAMVGAEDLVLCGRVIPLGEFSMMSGAALMFDPDLAKTFVDGLRSTWPGEIPAGLRRLSPPERSKIAGYLIDWALRDPEEVLEALSQGGDFDDEGRP